MSTLIAFGNLERRFDRMAQCVLGELAAMPGPVVIQAGVNLSSFKHVLSNVTVFPTCDFVEFERLMMNSTAVITHGGAGTIQAAVSAGMRPAVFVRKRALGEHIDDHQVEWCERLFSAGLAEEMRDQKSLREYLARREFLHGNEGMARQFFDSSALRADLHHYIRATLALK